MNFSHPFNMSSYPFLDFDQPFNDLGHPFKRLWRLNVLPNRLQSVYFLPFNGKALVYVFPFAVTYYFLWWLFLELIQKKG